MGPVVVLTLSVWHWQQESRGSELIRHRASSIYTIRKYECPIKKEEKEEESTNEIIYYLARGIFYFFYEIPGTNINNDAIHNDAI